jgi:hypothetical protein
LFCSSSCCTVLDSWDDLPLGVGTVLVDHDEGREDDRLQGDDRRQQPERVALDAERDPASEPEDVDIDERSSNRRMW